MKTLILWRGFSTQLDFEEILIPKTKGSNLKLLKLINDIKFTNLDSAIKNTISSYKKFKIYKQKN